MATDLIPFTTRQLGTETVHTVNARDLYAFLALTGDYNLWITRAIKRANLIENIDFGIYYQVVENTKRGPRAAEHHLTFDAAKHVAMMSSADKGHEVRTYFIAKEKELLARQHDPIERYPELRAIRELLIATAEARDEATAARHEAGEAKVEAQHAKALAQTALETQHFLTIREYVFLNHLERQLPPSLQTAYGRYLAGYCLEKGIPVRLVQVADRQYDAENGYHGGTIETTLPPWLTRRHGQGTLRVLPAGD